jgi:hypothetical protein
LQFPILAAFALRPANEKIEVLTLSTTRKIGRAH